jgi:CRP-like cAMP-binding protein
MNAAELGSVPLFAALSEGCRARLAESARRVHFEAGQEIVREKAFSFEFYAIESGTADVMRGGEHVVQLAAGEFFGEMGVLPQRGLKWTRRNSAVVARSVVSAIAIPGHHFRRACDDMPELRDAVMAAVAARQREPESV